MLLLVSTLSSNENGQDYMPGVFITTFGAPLELDKEKKHKKTHTKQQNSNKEANIYIYNNPTRRFMNNQNNNNINHNINKNKNNSNNYNKSNNTCYRSATICAKTNHNDDDIITIINVISAGD